MIVKAEDFSIQDKCPPERLERVQSSSASMQQNQMMGFNLGDGQT